MLGLPYTNPYNLKPKVMSKKLHTKQCEKCFLMLPGDTLLTGPFVLCRVCSERYIDNLPVEFNYVEN